MAAGKSSSPREGHVWVWVEARSGYQGLYSLYIPNTTNINSQRKFCWLHPMQSQWNAESSPLLQVTVAFGDRKQDQVPIALKPVHKHD